MIPGDPARAAAGQGASKERVSEIRKEFGLDLPVYIQIYKYFGRIINLDLGKSISTKKDVLDEIILYLPASMELVVSAMFINILFGILIGVYSAIKPRQIIDKLSNIITILGMGLPIFWVGIISQLLFYKILDIFPYGGRLPAGINPPVHHTGSYNRFSSYGGYRSFFNFTSSFDPSSIYNVFTGISRYCKDYEKFNLKCSKQRLHCYSKS